MLKNYKINFIFFPHYNIMELWFWTERMSPLALYLSLFKLVTLKINLKVDTELDKSFLKKHQ